jgi:prephenate dehydrogenase
VNPPFTRVGIVGLGLIGGSIALGLRRRWPSIHVLGVDRPEVSAAARRLGVLSDTRGEIENLRDVEIVILATPVPQIVADIEAADAAGLEATITDVGSTKRVVVGAAKASHLRFVGGHPVAGAAQGGLNNARPDLFDGREWLVVPATGQPADMERVNAMVRGLGAAPRVIDADSHDRVMAYVSHLPQLLASALMTVAGRAVGADGLTAAGQGFADMTRLAASDTDVWRGIFATNADYVAEAVRDMVAALPADAGLLADVDKIDALFHHANRWAARNQNQT